MISRTRRNDTVTPFAAHPSQKRRMTRPNREVWSPFKRAAGSEAGLQAEAQHDGPTCLLTSAEPAIGGIDQAFARLNNRESPK